MRRGRRLAKQTKSEEHDSRDRWLVSYADFITLLFAFFTVLYATSQQDLTKQEEFQNSARKYFKGGFGFGAAGEMHSDTDSSNLIEPPFQTFPSNGAGPKEVQNYVAHKLAKDLTDAEFKSTIEDIRSDGAGVRIHLTAATLFPKGSANLKESALGALDKIGDLLKQTDHKIVIEGHTDDEPIHTSQYPSNWELSAARATKIARYLIQVQNIDARRLVPVAYADKHPLAPNTTEDNRAHNRRIELLIVTDNKKTAL